ncbi:MAG: hypothetical protein HY902_06820 [Deltaproteobacteria bacterium]|nr:hypothetical protein [Deltaproteobacteria bacterium]
MALNLSILPRGCTAGLVVAAIAIPMWPSLGLAVVPTAGQLAARPAEPPPPVSPIKAKVMQRAAERLGTPREVQAAPEPAAASPAAAPAAATTAVDTGGDTFATAPKPPGFLYSMLQDAWIDDVRETYLYIKSSPTRPTSLAVPIPKNRAFLATCIHGGTIDDLVRSATATVKWDPAGVVRPDITIIKKAELEIYDNAKVLDRGGDRLYINTAEGVAKGFALEGGAAAWDEVIEGAKFNDLVAGTLIRVENDPSGRKPIRVIFKQKAPAIDASGVKRDRGCGCDLRPGDGVSAGAGLFAAALLALLWVRRQRSAS